MIDSIVEIRLIIDVHTVDQDIGLGTLLGMRHIMILPVRLLPTYTTVLQASQLLFDSFEDHARKML